MKLEVSKTYMKNPFEERVKKGENSLIAFIESFGHLENIDFSKYEEPIFLEGVAKYDDVYVIIMNGMGWELTKNDNYPIYKNWVFGSGWNSIIPDSYITKPFKPLEIYFELVDNKCVFRDTYTHNSIISFDYVNYFEVSYHNVAIGIENLKINL